MDVIEYTDFAKVDVRVGTIIEALPFPEARQPAYQLLIDFGPAIGHKKSSAQITVLYTLSDLIGKQIVAVVNFEPKQIGPMRSEVLILGVPDEKGDIVLITPTNDQAINGGRLH